MRSSVLTVPVRVLLQLNIDTMLEKKTTFANWEKSYRRN